jgi:hypothetical protein
MESFSRRTVTEVRPFGNHRRKWEDIIKTNFIAVGCELVDWNYLVLDTVQRQVSLNTVLNVGFHKRRQVYDQVRNCQLYKKPCMMESVIDYSGTGDTLL